MWRVCWEVFFIGIMGLLPAMPGLAATQTLTAHIAFATPGSALKTSDIDFGAIRADAVGTHTITPDGVVTTNSPIMAADKTAIAGKIMVSGAMDQPVNITVTQYTDGSGISPRNATCAYGNRPPRPCEISDAPPPGNGKTLSLGVQAVVNHEKPHNTASPSFTVTIAYQ